MKRPAAINLGEALRGLRDELAAAGLESPGAEAERLLSHVLEMPRARLAVEQRRPFPPASAAILARLVRRRLSGEPLQHIEGLAQFRDLVLRADGRALIPRPETEQLIDLVARSARSAEPGEGSGVVTVRRPSPVEPAERALDIGTGGGALALALLAENLARHVVALDVSEAALSQARENLDRTGIDASRLDLRLCSENPFGALGAEERFDLLVSNPPYVCDGDLEGLPPEVRDFEPRNALAGGVEGLDLYRLIAAHAPTHLVAGARAFLEIGADQGEAVQRILAEARGWADVACRSDLAGRDRFVTAVRA